MNEITEEIDRLLHDAQHADSGAKLASAIGHRIPAKELRENCESLKAQAFRLYLAHADAGWPHPDELRMARSAAQESMIWCCERDGYIQSLGFAWRFCLALRLNRLADWLADKKRSALLLRHPWMGKPRWL